MEIKHCPLFKTDVVCEKYSEKDGVPITYVCTTALGHDVEPMDVFYRETPHPEFNNKYFGLFMRSSHVYITNADKVEELEFGLVEDDEGKLQYSEGRWDYKQFNNGNMIDGGRSYVRSSGCKVYMYEVRDGKMVPQSEVEAVVEEEEPYVEVEAEYDMSIHSTPNAKAWTDFFFKTWPDCNVEYDIMMGWFANAMMAMHDGAKNELEIGEASELTDFFGNKLAVGQKVLLVGRWGSSLNFGRRVIDEIKDGVVYVRGDPDSTVWGDNTKRAKVNYPERLVISPEYLV